MIIHDVEQNTPEWYALRGGMPTASAASNLVTSTGKDSTSMAGYAMTLAGELYDKAMLEDAWQGNSYTQFGHDTEDEAALAYAMRGCDVQTVGFCTDDNVLYGASPDRFVDDDGILEIKCLPKQHIKALVYIHAKGKAPPEYVMQPQAQILVTGRKWVDLLFYHPILPMQVIRQHPDPKLQDALKRQLEAVITERSRVLDILENL